MNSQVMSQSQTFNAFHKLSDKTLNQILNYYKVDGKQISDHMTLTQLAVNAFQSSNVIDISVLDSFLNKLCSDGKKEEAELLEENERKAREEFLSSPAEINEQVAVNFSKNSGEASWILGKILDYDQSSQKYKVQDEDDFKRVISVSKQSVRRLIDTNSHIKKGDKVLVVFPETTSFYPAKVLLNPLPYSNHSSSLSPWEVIVRFDDDEDASGNCPARRVPARFVMSLD